LDITEDFVDGAQVVILEVNVQVGVGDVFPEKLLIRAVRLLCGVNLTSKKMLRLT